MNKKYSAEGLIDLEEQIAEAIGSAPIKADKNGMMMGTFTVRIEHTMDDENEASGE